MFSVAPPHTVEPSLITPFHRPWGGGGNVTELDGFKAPGTHMSLWTGLTLLQQEVDAVGTPSDVDMQSLLPVEEPILSTQEVLSLSRAWASCCCRSRCCSCGCCCCSTGILSVIVCSKENDWVFPSPAPGRRRRRRRSVCGGGRRGFSLVLFAGIFLIVRQSIRLALGLAPLAGLRLSPALVVRTRPSP